MRRPDRRFVARGLIVGLAALVLGLLWLSANLQAVLLALAPGLAPRPTTGPTPPPPTLSAPRGELPAGHAGLEEWAQFADGSVACLASGFLLRLTDGTVLGVTTAHSLYFNGWPARAITHLAFRLPQATADLVRFSQFFGRPGRIFTGYNFQRDYVLLRPETLPADLPVLDVDPRGAPEPGERVVLYSGLGDGAGGPRPLTATVTAVSAAALWAQMDEVFAAGGLSGSPLLSTHTGRVVGMAVSAGDSTPLLIGFHPAGALSARAAAAADLFAIGTYQP